MKKLLILLLGVAIGIAISYFHYQSSDHAEESKEELKAVSAPKGIITEEQGKVLDAAFNSRHQLISDSIVKRPDNRSSWYSLEDMRDYLNYAEAETRTLGYTMNGVRIYLGAHPNGGGLVGYTTMFLVPTGTKGVSEGSMLNFSFQGGGDIPGGPGLNDGDDGFPPNANYPNN